MDTNTVITDRQIANALVYIDGKEVNFASLYLGQAIGEHHQFCIKLDYDAMNNRFLSNPLEQIALIGKWLKVELQQGDDGGNSY